MVPRAVVHAIRDHISYRQLHRRLQQHIPPPIACLIILSIKTLATPTKSFYPIRPPWFDNECRSLHLHVVHGRLHKSLALHTACHSLHRTHRCKKHACKEQEGKRLVDSLFSSSTSAFWREFIPRSPPPLLDCF
ncbi:hypothetical protein O6H91_Y035700 [Diphasiastrum complanatum]|nr:hypothetical protein O6H91_Y035700 [Diphasiastrum complanatum]